MNSTLVWLDFVGIKSYIFGMRHSLDSLRHLERRFDGPIPQRFQVRPPLIVGESLMDRQGAKTRETLSRRRGSLKGRLALNDQRLSDLSALLSAYRQGAVSAIG